MEARLGAALAADAGLGAAGGGAAEAPAPLPAEAGEGVGVVPPAAAVEPSGTGGLFGDDAPWPTDEAGESAFLTGAKERGETVVRLLGPARDETVDDKSPLPPLADLVARIPAETREVLEELFRVKFTTVQRVPAKYLKP